MQRVSGCSCVSPETTGVDHALRIQREFSASFLRRAGGGNLGKVSGKLRSD